MDRDTAVSVIANRLGRRSDPARLNIATEMIVAQERLENEMEEIPWFLISEKEETATTANDERVKLPDDFLKEVDDMFLWLYDATADDPEKELEKGFYDDIVNSERFTGSGAPKVYAIVGDYFRLRPIPDSNYTIKMIYAKRGTALTSNIENEWLKHASELLIAETGMIVAENVHNDKAYARFSRDKMAAKTALMKKMVARQMANQELFMGGGE